MFRKALLTLDRSPFSDAAISRAADVTQSEVVVLEVVDSVAEILGRAGPAFEVPADIAEQLRETERAEVQEHLDQAAAQLREAGVAKVSTLVREGRPGQEIVDAARGEGCDVIVMSTHGRTGVARALLGSVANYVVHHAEGVAVLLVRPGSEG